MLRALEETSSYEAPAEEEEQSTDHDLVVAVGNVAKAARRVGMRAVKAPTKDSTDMDDDDVCNINPTSATTTSKQENETCTRNCGSISADIMVHVVDCDDANEIGRYGEEEIRACYTTSTTMAQSNNIIQERQQQQVEQGINGTFISIFTRFLDQSWKWLYYFLVTILFLNFVQFACRHESVDGEVDGATKENENIPVEKNNTEQEVDDELLLNNITSFESEDRGKFGDTMGDVGCKLSGDDDSFIEASSESNHENGNESVEGVGCIGFKLSGDDASFIEGSSESNCENGKETVDDVGCQLSGDDAFFSESSSQVSQRILSQLESLFTDDQLAKDSFLLKHVRRKSDGFVSLKLVAGLRKVKRVSQDFPLLVNALKDSSTLEMNPEETKVRRVQPLTPFLESISIKSKVKKSTNTNRISDGGRSNNHQNQQPTDSNQDNNQYPSKSSNSENENNVKGVASHESQNLRRKNSNASSNENQSRRSSNTPENNQQKKSSNTSTASSHNSVSKVKATGTGVPQPSGKQYPIVDNLRTCNIPPLFGTFPSGLKDQSPQGKRRSLPATDFQHTSSNNANLPRNSSRPIVSVAIRSNGARPKSNSYCEESNNSTTMSPWLQRRKAFVFSKLYSGEVTISGVIRQPRGPDGTKGFNPGYRAMIRKERFEQSSTVTPVN